MSSEQLSGKYYSYSLSALRDLAQSFAINGVHLQGVNVSFLTKKMLMRFVSEPESMRIGTNREAVSELLATLTS